jgi:hypothetical protein
MCGSEDKVRVTQAALLYADPQVHFQAIGSEAWIR